MPLSVTQMQVASNPCSMAVFGKSACHQGLPAMTLQSHTSAFWLSRSVCCLCSRVGERQMKTAAAAASSTAATRTGSSTVRTRPGCVPRWGLATWASGGEGMLSDVSKGHSCASDVDKLLSVDLQRDSNELGGRSGSSRDVGGRELMPGARWGRSWRVATNHASSGNAKGTAGRALLSAP